MTHATYAEYDESINTVLIVELLADSTDIYIGIQVVQEDIMRLNIAFISRICLLVLLALVAISSLRVADNGVARAQDPVPTYYCSAGGSAPALANCWVVDTKLTQGSYRIFKVVNVQGNPEHTEQWVTGAGPNGDGNYKLLVSIIQPGGEDDLPLAYFYVSGL